MILVIKELSGQSFRSIENWFKNHKQYLPLCGFSSEEYDDFPSFRTLSYRCARIDFNDMIFQSIIVFMFLIPYDEYFHVAAVDGTVIKPCKDHRAQLQRKNHHYNDPNASWTVSTKQKWEYGYKGIIACDVHSSLILGYHFQTAKNNEASGLKKLINRFKEYHYVLLDAAYDSYEIFYKLRKETTALPIIDINPRRGRKTPYQEDSNERWLMKSIRIKYKKLYRKRWEIERINNVLESQLFMEFIFYTPHRHYNQAVGLKIMAYNIQVITNLFFQIRLGF
jgi:hypothetical protein